MGDQQDPGGFMQNMEGAQQQYHKEARKREIERMKREFMDLKARNFKKGAAAGKKDLDGLAGAKADIDCGDENAVK